MTTATTLHRHCSTCKQPISAPRIHLCQWLDENLSPSYCDGCAKENSATLDYPEYPYDLACQKCGETVGSRRVHHVNTANVVRKRLGEAPMTLKYCWNCSR